MCNGQSPCPTLYAEEGDLVELMVKSDVYSQSSIHWYVGKPTMTIADGQILTTGTGPGLVTKGKIGPHNRRGA